MTDPLGLIGRASGMPGVSSPRPAGTVNPAEGPSFKDLLMKNIQQVNDMQQEAQTAIEDLMAGRRDDMATVMGAQKKAAEAFKLLMQVRNKLQDAYEEVKQIRV